MKIFILIVITILSITVSCCHSKRIIKPSFVSAEEEKEIMLDVAKQAEIYTNELGEMGMGPANFCDIRETNDMTDCETYLEEVGEFFKTIKMIFDSTPKVITHGPISLVVPMKEYKKSKTPEDRLKILEEEYKKFVNFYEENIPIGKDALPLEDIAPFMRATGSLFQRALFNWHYHWASTDIYDRLAADEVSYVNTFFELYGYEHFFFKFGYFYGNRMSSFTYSHRRKGPLPIKSGRFACGTTSQEQAFASSAVPVLDRLGIELDSHYDKHPYDFSFYGLGWDHDKNYFKVYIMFHDINKMPEKYLDLTTKKLAKAGITSNPETLSLAEHGLISLTYIVKYPDDVYEKMQCENAPNDDGIKCQNKMDSKPTVTLQEEKIYIYPLDEELEKQNEKGGLLTMPKATVGAAWMFATKRDFVPQYDVRVSDETLAQWRKNVGLGGSAIMNKYESIGLYLETMNYFGNDKFVLYFPAGSG